MSALTVGVQPHRAARMSAVCPSWQNRRIQKWCT